MKNFSIIGLFVFLFLMPIGQSSFASSKTAELNILTLNTWMIPIQGKLPKERAKIIGEQVAKYDLVFLQEAFTRKVRKIIKANTSEKFNDLYIYQIGNVLGNGLYNLSKFKILKSKFMPFFSCRNIQCAASKGVLYMQLDLGNGFIIDTFNTHLQAYQKDEKIRKKQLGQTIAFINKINDGSLPILFAGDFNIIASTPEYKTLSNALIGYKDAWVDYRASDAGFSWNPDINSWANYDENETVQQQRIDYIFLRDGAKSTWNVLETEIELDQPIASESGAIFASDHFGVSGKLELRTHQE